MVIVSISQTIRNCSNLVFQGFFSLICPRETLILIIFTIIMQDSNEGNLHQKRLKLFQNCPKSIENQSHFQNLKSQASCLFYWFSTNESQKQMDGESKRSVWLQIRESWVCQVDRKDGRVLSTMRCNGHCYFEVVRRKEQITGDLQPVGLQLSCEHSVNDPLTLHIEGCQRTRLQQFAKVLSSKHIVQRGFYKIFKPIRRIGKGATSHVYSALNMVDRKIYAVKCCLKSDHRPHAAETRDAAFKKEFKIWRSLDHPFISRLLTAFETHNSVYMVTEQLHITLHGFITRYGYIKKNRVKQLLRDILQGIIYLHSMGVMHRDIKLQNIMFKKEDLNQGRIVPVIVDFGLAQEVQQEKYLFYRCGTPGYTAPEVLAPKSEGNQESYNEKCDIFSYGVVAYTLLCKKAPFQNDQIHKVIGDNTNYSLDLCSTLKDAIGEEAVDFLEKLLAKDPKARPSASQALKHPFLSQQCEPSEEKWGSTTIEIPPEK